MLRVSTAFLGAAAALAALSSAPAGAQQQTAANDEEAGDQNAVSTIVCRRVAAPTGTRIGTRRICKTQHEWDLIRDETRDTVDQATSRNQFGPGS